MLQSLRDYFPNWLIASLLGLLGLLVVVTGLYSPSHRGSKASQAVLARINRKKIRKCHVEQAYEILKQQQTRMKADARITPEMENELRVSILKQLVVMEVLKQRSYANHYRVHPDEIWNLVQQMPVLQVNGQFSSQQLTKVLAATGYTRAAFFKELADNRLISQLSGAIMQSAFVLPKEVNHVVRLVHQQRDFSYLELKALHFATPPTQLPIEAVQAYYDQHLTEFRVPEQVSIDYLVVSRADLFDKIKAAHSDNNVPLEEQVAQQFSDNLDRLTQLRDTHPHSLTEASQALNVSIQSTPLFSRAGGSTEITQHPDVIQAAFSAEVRQGYHSPLIRLDADRVVILRLKQHQPLRLASLEEVQETVRQQLSLQRGKEAARRRGEELIEKMKQDFTRSLDLPADTRWCHVEKATRDNERVPAALLSAAFAMPHQGKVPRVTGIMLPNGDYVIIRLSKVRVGKLSQLDETQRDLYQAGLAAELGKLDYLQYIRASENRATITYSFDS